MMMIMAVLGAGRRGESWVSFTWRLEVPRPALRGGEVKPGEEEPGGKEDGAHSSFGNHCFHRFHSNFWVSSLCSYFDQQELWSETIHWWLTAE